MTRAGISFEAAMSPGQAAELAALMAAGRPTRPAGVLAALLEYSDGRGRLLAVWQDRETLERYLAETPVPRGLELMRKAGVEPDRTTTFEILEYG